MAILHLQVRIDYNFSLRRAILTRLMSVTKALSVFGILIDSLGIRFNSRSDKYVGLLLANANTGYAEVSWISRTTLLAQPIEYLDPRPHCAKSLHDHKKYVATLLPFN